MPCNSGRNVAKSAKVSQNSGVNIIVPTGLHLESYYPPHHWRFHYNEDQLTRLFIADIEEGIDRFDYTGPLVERTPYKAGLIKLVTDDEPFTQHQELVFRAVVNAHLETGVPILTHTNHGNQALEQALKFDELGANMDHVVLSHLDRRVDIDYHREVLLTGVRIEYDSAFRWKPHQKNGTHTLLKALLPEFSQQITMGMDLARNTYWRSYGGAPGLDFLLTQFKSDFSQIGLEEFYRDIFYQVPQKLFTFSKNDIYITS
jgi:phosphotriesterase-related protein